jgi:hypothetical protein
MKVESQDGLVNWEFIVLININKALINLQIDSRKPYIEKKSIISWLDLGREN